MEKIIEEINQIIDKVEKELPKGLSEDNAERLLEEIKVDLGKVKESAKEEPTVVKKIDEIKKEVNRVLGQTLGFTETQDALNGVKSGLEEVKKEIKRLEESKQNLLTVSQQKVPRRSNSPNFLEVTNAIMRDSMEIEKIGTEMGEKALPVIGTAAGSWAGLATGVGTGAVRMGGYFVDKGMDEFADGFESVVKSSEKITGQIIGEGAGITKQTIVEGADIAKKVVEGFSILGAAKNITENLTKGIGHANEVSAESDSKARIAEANAKAEAAKAEAQAKIAEANARAIEAQLKLAELKLQQEQNPK